VGVAIEFASFECGRAGISPLIVGDLLYRVLVFLLLLLPLRVWKQRWWPMCTGFNGNAIGPSPRVEIIKTPERIFLLQHHVKCKGRGPHYQYSVLNLNLNVHLMFKGGMLCISLA